MAGEHGIFLDFTVTDTAENDLIEVQSTAVANRGMVFKIQPSATGTLRVFWKFTDGTFSQIGNDKAITSGIPETLDFDFRIPEAKVTFEAPGGSGSIKIEGIAYS